jgi:hypothetical protein
VIPDRRSAQETSSRTQLPPGAIDRVGHRDRIGSHAGQYLLLHRGQPRGVPL